MVGFQSIQQQAPPIRAFPIEGEVCPVGFSLGEIPCYDRLRAQFALAKRGPGLRVRSICCTCNGKSKWKFSLSLAVTDLKVDFRS